MTRKDVESAYQAGLLLPLTQALVTLSHTHPISPMRGLVMDDVAKALDAILTKRPTEVPR